MAGHATASFDRPLIGVTPRWVAPVEYMGETLAPNEAVADNFLDAIIAAGGMPVMLPLTSDKELIRHYVDLCDGFSIPGGQDPDPKLWGEVGNTTAEEPCPRRDALEVPLVRMVAEADKPLFATCRGVQIMNVALGGTLCTDVPNLPTPEGTTHWRHVSSLVDVVHPVEVVPGTLLSRCVDGASMIQVNSAHHCCVSRICEGGLLSARSAVDRVPEAIELPEKRFFLGVQWHPEYTWRKLDTDFGLWKAFVAAC